jgi:uncharacterized membrane protein YhaH (DUF805 family)
MNWFIEVVKKYAVFTGRARRKEYWFYVLFYLIFALIIGIVDAMIFGVDPGLSTGPLGTIYVLALLIPSLAVGVRRLHDTSRSGWWMLLLLLPVIGPIILLVFFVLDSTPGTNAYGPNPKEAPEPA